MVDAFFDEFLSFDIFWKKLLQNKNSARYRIYSYHFCFSYLDLIAFTQILKKYDQFPPLILKNINYLISFTKKEISEKIKKEDLEKNFFIIHSNKIKKKESIENILLLLNKTENDIFKAFLCYLLFNEKETDLLDEFSQNEGDINTIKQKPKLVFIYFFKIYNIQIIK